MATGVPTPFSHCSSIWTCYTASNLALAHKKNWIKYMHYKKIIWQWKHKLKDAQLLWQGNLPNHASKIKRLLARHDIHLPRASGQVLSYTSVIRVNAATSQQVRVKEATPPGRLSFWILSGGWMPPKRALARTMASAFWWWITVTPKSLENHKKNQ
jgi:hypothetical protein